MTLQKYWTNIKNNPWTAAAWFVVLLVSVLLTLNMLIPWEWVWPSQIMGAILGALITIIATRMLISKQSEINEESNFKLQQVKSQAEKDLKRNTTIFERKLDIYQDFIETLNKVLEDGVITPQEALLLKFKVSMVALHADGERVNAISKAIKEIVQSLSRSNGLEVDKVSIETLFAIVQQFRIDIYDDNNTLPPDKLQETYDNFNHIDELFSDASKIIGSKKGDITKNGWSPIQETDSLYAFEKGNIRLRIARDPKLYFSVVLDPPYEICQREAYLNLRRKFGGGFNCGRPWGWYLYFNDEYATASDEEVKDAINDSADNFNDYLSRYLFNIAQFIDSTIRPLVEVWNLLSDNTKWRKFMYLDDIQEYGLCLANQYDYLEMKPFIDFLISNDNNYSVVLSVRDGEDKLAAFLQSIDIEDTRADKNSRLVSTFDDRDKATEYSKHLMNMIENNYPPQ